jgi:hypothetical protein
MMDKVETSIQPNVGYSGKTARNTCNTYLMSKEQSTASVPTASAKQLFRPIKFESSPPTPATPEGIESSGSKSTMENGSESGSDYALDSAYSSDNPQLPLVENGQHLNRITAVLQNRTLWKDFRKIGNEMIVTKPGR